jgi:hypothetical protein
MRTSTAARSVLLIACLFGPSPTIAQTPTCGTAITTPGAVVTFDGDMVCDPGFTGNALTIQSDGVIVDGAGFSILAR